MELTSGHEIEVVEFLNSRKVKILENIEDKTGEVVNWYLERYGQTAQILLAMEELGELVSGLNQYFFRNKISADQLSKEIADVEIMMQSLRVIVGNDLVDFQKEKQIEKMVKFKEESEKKLI